MTAAATRADRDVRPSWGVRRYLDAPYTSLQLLLVAGCGLLFLGLLMSASTTISASVHNSGDSAPWQQLIKEAEFIVLSLPVFWLAVRMPPSSYRRLAYPALTLAVIALLGVLIPGIGTTINGAHRWILLGPLTVQPSEFAKLAILLWGADLLARKESMRTLHSARHVLLPLVPGFAAMITLVMAEPDLGTSLCFMLLLLGLLWMVGLPLRYFTGLLALVAAAVTLLAVTESYRLQRLTTFLHPNLDPQGAGYHTLQGLYALSSGGLFGVGLGQGTSKYGWVPNANTDYVFAVVGEELGLLGCAVVLLLFGLFSYAAMRIALRSNDPFVRLVASGAAIWIAGQALINVGYVTALLPVTGIPLPFISNGGTSLILTCAVLGMLTSFARHEPDAVSAVRRSAAAGTGARWVRWLRLANPQQLQARKPKPKVATSRPPTQTSKAAPQTSRAAAQTSRTAQVSKPTTRASRPAAAQGQPAAKAQSAAARGQSAAARPRRPAATARRTQPAATRQPAVSRQPAGNRQPARGVEARRRGA
ncbi:MAG TPA: putative lipid II flippase FtsW [Jatrophihabitans sp.]|nr:putative lipid II flippase FtsW [Jatrophihabitans sp.]